MFGIAQMWRFFEAKKLCLKKAIKVNYKPQKTAEESFTGARYGHWCYVESIWSHPSYLLRQRYFGPPRLNYPVQAQCPPTHINMTEPSRKSTRAHQPRGIFE